MPSKSSIPCARNESSFSAPPNARAKSLGPLRHDSSVRISESSNRPGKSHSTDEEESLLDSVNLAAAKRLYQLRTETGLTQDELAALTGESRKQVHRRESNKVFLGPLRALVVLERAAGVKAVKGNK